MSGQRNLCSAFGLRVLSSVDVRGAARLESTSAPDVIIDYGDAAIAEGTRRSGPYTADSSGALVFEKENVARYRCTQTSIVVDACATAPQAEVAEMLIATALPAVLWQRGELVLHAAAAVLEGHTHAIAFAGVSGSGKSSLMRDLLHRGAAIVAEDSLCLRFDEEHQLQVSGLPACLHLRSPGDALDAKRTLLDVPVDKQKLSAPLAAIVVLETENDSSPAPLDAAQALQSLLAHRHRARVTQLLGILPEGLRQAAAVAAKTPLYSWKRSEGLLPLRDADFAWLQSLRPA